MHNLKLLEVGPFLKSHRKYSTYSTTATPHDYWFTNINNLKSTHSLSGFNFLNSYWLTGVGSGGSCQQRRYRLGSLYAITGSCRQLVVRVATTIAR